MKHNGTKKLETERLILRRFKLSDAKDMFENYARKENVTRYLTWETHKSISDSQDYLNNIVLPAYKTKDCYRWAIVWKETNSVIGAIDVVKNESEKKRAEIGYVLSDDFWGKGIMPEAGKKVVDYLFNEGYERIQAKHFSENAKSGRVMQKIGMKHEGTLRKYAYYWWDNENLQDIDVYSIIKGD